jgi:hypothetical protein
MKRVITHKGYGITEVGAPGKSLSPASRTNARSTGCLPGEPLLTPFSSPTAEHRAKGWMPPLRVELAAFDSLANNANTRG